MNHFLYNHHRRATRYAPSPPPQHPLNHHHLRHHHHDLLIPNCVIVSSNAPDYHPHAVCPENPILIPPHIPVLLDHDLRHRLPMASPYHHPNENPNPNHRRVVLPPYLDDQRVSINRRTKNRLASRVSRDSSLDNDDDQLVHKLNPAPNKPEKRKSVFLRIQPPKPNSADCEIQQELNDADFDVDSNPNSNSSRGKDNKHGCLGNGKRKLEKKEGKPVEVDISFELNSLVAKAVVSNTNLTPSVKKGKKRKTSVPHNFSSDSQLGKPAASAMNSNDISNSAKVLMSQNKAPDSCSKAKDNAHAKVQVAQSSKCAVPDEIAIMQSDKTSSRVVKKEKIVKKVIKKVVKPNSYKLSPLSTNILVGTLMAGGVTGSRSTASASIKIKKSSLKDKSTKEKKSDVPLLSLGAHSSSQQCNTDKGPDIGITGVGNISKPSSSNSSEEDKRTNLDCLFVNNNEGSIYEVNHIDDGKKHSCQSQVSQSPGKDSNVGCPQGSADKLIDTNILNAHNSISSNNLTARSEENFTVCDIDIDDEVVDKTCCEHDAPILSQNAILEENPGIAIPITSSGMASCSSSVIAMIQDGPDCLQQTSVVKLGSDSEIIDSEDSTTFPHADSMNDVRMQVSPSDVIVSSDNCEIQSFPDSNVLVVYGEGDTNEVEKRKFRTFFNFSPSKMDYMAPDVLSSVGLGNDVDTTLTLWKHPSPSEIFDHSVQRLDLSSQSNVNEITTFNVKKEVLEAELYFGNISDNDADKVSRLYQMKKTNAGYSNFTHCPSELSDDPISLNKQAHKEEVAWLSMAVLSSSPSVPYTEDIPKLSDNILIRECVESMDLNREAVSSDSLELQHSSIGSHSILEDLATPFVLFPELEGEQKVNASPSVTYTEDIVKLPDNSLGGESFQSMDLDREIMTSENLDLHHPSIASHALVEESVTPDVELPMLEREQKEKAALIVPNNIQSVISCKDLIVVVENIKVEKTDLQYSEENYPISDFVQRSPSVNMESFGINVKDDLVPPNNYCTHPPFDGGVVACCNSAYALIETMPNALSGLPSQGITSEVSDRRVSDCVEINNENICGDGIILDSKFMVEQCSDLLAFTLPAQRPGKIMKLDRATGQSNLTMRKMMPQPSSVPSEVAIQQSNYSELNWTKKEPGCATTKGHSFIFSKPKTPTSSIHTSKPRTWHRTGNNSSVSSPGSSPIVRTVPPEKSNIQNTPYIHKGNSLVRKPTPVYASSQISVANQLPSLGFDQSRKSTSSECRVSATDQSNLLNSGVKSAPLKGRGTVPLSKLKSGSSPLMVNLSVGCCGSAADSKNVLETNDAPSSSEGELKCSVMFENQIGISNNGVSQVEVGDGNISSSNAKRTAYIKPKSNQLVATSNFCGLSVSTDDKTQKAHSDRYYKNGKNQLLRTSFISHSPTLIMPSSNVNSGGLGACQAICSRRFTKRRSQKVSGSLCKPSKTSLVWTLSGKSSPKNDIDSGNRLKFLSQFFPWKRSIFRRRFIQNPASSSNRSSLSTISKKLLLLRKRNVVYPRSTSGFSFWKSNVLGVGGSSLKWSKTIYRRSTKVVEEGKLAVAAVEREKREQKDVACNTYQAKNNEPLPSASVQSGLAAKGYIPRYVRIDNGNQLIRDPKKRTRMLANEKVRWSLHTARQRLALKQKYCQFFTRFGKCNKGDRKCPYIHDPSKIAVCTKFLKGLCSNSNCELTHKLIPERMPDCSYFLQGLCTNTNCPYRHVYVNPKASICGEFLKGYCGDGKECRKKHSYVCPTFEETGRCQAGTKCKLHHPKKQGKGRKRKRSGDWNNGGGRYFGSIPIDISEPGMMMVAQRQCQLSNNDKEGDVADYISFEVDDEVEENVDQSYEQATVCENDHCDLQLDNLDELIRPVLIM